VIATFVPPGAEGPPTHTHDGDQLYFVVEGELEVELGTETKTVKQGSVVFIPEGVPHHNRNAGDRDELHLEVIAPTGPPGMPVAVPVESMDANGLPYYVREADTSAFGGTSFSIAWLANRAEGSRHVSMNLAEVPPGASGPPMHVHEFDQFYFVLDGTLSVEVALQRFDVGPGNLVVLPAGVPHWQWNEGSAPERHLTMLVPEPDQPNSPEHPWDTAVEFAPTGEHIGF
jgi:mannose-6-phosphate isomerase-like protein (cupin superfamily)